MIDDDRRSPDLASAIVTTLRDISAVVVLLLALAVLRAFGIRPGDLIGD